jgi:predicted short-subunit dehydrogenase-like oxidoreductase (DUF2520 family)
MASKKSKGARQSHDETVSIIGAGRMGGALALALTKCGYRVEALVARRKSQAARVASLIPSKPQALSSSELRGLPASDILFITTPDDAIRDAASRLSSEIVDSTKRRVALHTSGALSSDELKSLRERGFQTGSMHPLVAVTDARAGAESLRRAFFCIEGERSAASAARRIVRALGARAFSISTRHKALYHAAAVISSGHAVALFDIALEMLARCGLKSSEARAILLPLLRSTVENLSSHEPARALTGTFARADISTVRRHLEAIQREKMRDALAAYALLGRRSVRLAKEKGMDAPSLEEILEALEEAAKLRANL